MYMFIESTYCSYYVVIQNRFWVFNRGSGSAGIDFGDGFSPKLVFWADFSFMFGFGCLDTPSDLNPPV